MRHRSIDFAGAALALAIVTTSLAAADTHIQKDLELSPGGKLMLDTVVGAVTVTPGSGSGAHVVITARSSDFEDKITLAFEELPDNRIRVSAKRKGVGSGFGSRFREVKFDIRVPAKTDLELSTSGGAVSVSGIEGRADLETSGGSITVQDHRGEVTADTSGGPIRVKRIEGSVNLDTSGGSIQADDVSGNVRADTSGGGITIEEAGGRVVASTSGGSIDVSFSKGNFKGGSLETSGGGIRVKLDPAAGLRIDASSSGGTVTCDLPVTVQGEVKTSRLRGTVGGGGELLELSTSGGGIRISPR